MDTIEMCFDCLAYCIDILDIIMQLINANKQEKPVILQDNKWKHIYKQGKKVSNA